MDKKQIAVVGCGWLGFPLAKKLVEDNHMVYGTSRDDQKLKKLEENGIKAQKFTYADFDKTHAWLAKCDFLIINIPPSDFKFTYAEKMQTLTKSLNDKAKVIFVSSTSVYADKNKTVFESTPTTGDNRSGKWVREAENLLSKKLKNRLTIIRMAGLVGKERHPVKFMSGKSYSGAEAPVNLIHLEDCIGIIQKVIDSNYWGEILNGCSLHHPSKTSFYSHFAEKLNIPPPEFTNDPVDYKIVDASKVQNELGYKFKYENPFDFPVD